MLLLDIQKNIVSNFVKLRISNSNLLIEQGRHQNIPLENRLCPICKLEIENEYHFVIECNKLTSSRSTLYSKVTEIVSNFLVMSDSDKFKYILSSNDYDIMKICVIGISEMCSERNKLLKSNAKLFFYFKYFIDKSIGLDNRLCLYKSSPTTRWNNLNTIYIRHRSIYPSCIHAIHLNYQA
jgi:hypothetical protein